MSLTTCIRKAGTALRAEDKNAILARTRELMKAGQSAQQAAEQAVDAQIATVRALLSKYADPNYQPAPAAPQAAPKTSQEAGATQDSKTPKPSTKKDNPTVEKGSGSVESAIANMIDDGDVQAAVDFAAAKKVDIREVLKDQKARLAKIAGLTPTEAAAEPAPVQEPEPTPAEPAASIEPPQEGIQDFGEKLEGARKDQAPSLAKTYTDDDIAREPFSKLWPADEIAKLDDKFAAAVATTARAMVPAKPRKEYALKRWVKTVKMVRDLAQKIVSGSVTREAFMQGLDERYVLRDFGSKVRLLEQIDREQWGRIGGVSEAPDAYRYDDGKQVQTPMVRVEVDGRSHWLEGSGNVDDQIDSVKLLLERKAPDKRMQFEIREDIRKGEVFINKAGDPEKRRLKTFADVKQARAFLNDNYDDLVAAWDAVKERDNVHERDVRGDVNRPRAGADYRSGKDVTPEQFAQQFGFRGVQFGNWVDQGKGAKDRQGMLNQAYDALMDLANIVNVPPRAISLNGSLGLAFGARGSGWASAHYEPDTLVINLTKTRGAGTLAHEWFHALDNYFSHQRGGAIPMARGMSQEDYRQANYITYRPEPMMVRKDGRTRPMSKERLAEMRQANPKSGWFAEDQWQVDPKHPAGVRPEVEKRVAELVNALNASPMAVRSMAIDSGENGYWSRVIERAARSFENYVLSKMMERGFHNDYLANVKPVQDFPRSKERYPYLLPEELAPIAKAFDDLFATIDTKTDDAGNVVMFQRTTAEPFYSELARQVEKVNRNAGPASDWKAWVKGLPQKGVKPDEIEWTGINDWLDTQTGKVTKQQVLDFLNANGVRVTETVLGDKFAKTREEDRIRVELDALGFTLSENNAGIVLTRRRDGTRFVYDSEWDAFVHEDDTESDDPRMLESGDDSNDARADRLGKQYEILQLSEAERDEEIPGGTRYGTYTLPGGTNYREVLLTLPSNGQPLSEDALPSLRREQARADRAAGDYRSSHWDQPNVLAHVRLDDRTDSEGKRVLFVEEIQSDWAQQGKKRGFKPTDAEAAAIKAEYDAAAKAVQDAHNDDRSNLEVARRRMADATDAYNKRINDATIPSAPFVGKTDAWVSLALKRIIKMAVDEGYDKVAFVTGEQSADRYSLRKQVRSIEWSPFTVAGGNMPGGTHVIIDTPSGLARFNVDGNGVIESAPNPGILRGEQIEGKRLDDVVGKAAAEKIMGTYRGKLEGEGLNIGGEGMVAFYNRIVPTVLKDVLRKVGGGEIGQIDIAGRDRAQGQYSIRQEADGRWQIVEGERETQSPASWYTDRAEAQRVADMRNGIEARTGTTQPGFTITPAMREKAAGGLPLFKRDETPAAAAKRGRAQQLADHLSDVWANAPRVVVVDSMADSRVPQVARDELARQDEGTPTDGKTTAFYYNDTVYLIGEQSEREALTSLFHEVLGHHGLRHAFPGGELRTILDRIAQLNPGLVRTKAKQYGLDFDKTSDRRIAAEEVLAEMAATRPNIGWVKRALAAIRSWLRDHVPGFAGMRFTNDELIRSFLLPARRWVESGAERGNRESVPMQRGGQRAFGNAERLTRLTESAAFREHGLRGLEIPQQRVVLESVTRAIHDSEIRKAVVELIPVKVMHDLAGKQGAADQLLNNEAVLQNIRSINSEDSVPLLVDAADALVRAHALVAAERVLPPGQRPLSAEHGVAMVAPQRDGTAAKLADASVAAKRPTAGSNVIGAAGETNAAVRAGKVQDRHVVTPTSDDVLGGAGGDTPTPPPSVPMFSRVSDAIDTLKSATTEKGLRDILSDHLTSDKTFNWWHNTIGTQYQKAKADPTHFGPVYEAAQDYLHDTSAFANDAAALAPDVVPQLKGWRDAFKPLRLSDADEQALASAIFTGTLQDQKVYTPDELRAQFNATDRQIALYQQMRAAIDRSLDQLVASDVARYLGQDIPKAIKDMISDGDTGRFKGLVTDLAQKKKAEADAALTEVRKANRKRLSDMHRAHKKRREAAKGPMARSNLEDVLATERAEVVAETKAREDAAKATYDKWNEFERTIKAKYERVDQLKQEGYAPLMRFGRYTVDVVSDEGERQFFGLYESEPDAKKAAREFRESGEFKGSTITTGLLSQEAYKQFSSMAPETIELFAEVAGVEQTPLFQEYLRRAKSNRAAIKRLIQRKGIAGFSEDAQRVLAAFLTSNARAASTNLHMGDMGRLIEAIPKEKGDVKDEAIRLKEYVQNPTEEAQRLRGLLFVQYLGGSIAAALVNMTQPLTMTLPYLSQFGGLGKAGARLADAMKSAMHKQTGALGAALAKAEKEGIVSPQEVHQLHAEASRSLGSNPTWRRVLFAWGSMFSLAEQFNRRVSFIAAWNTAKANGNPNPYQFAVDAVEQTQGVYNRGNRPNWARGPVGATVFTFKQFSISYLEFLKRLPPKERAIALAVLVLAAGAQGLPFADDLDDLIDTIGQHLGYDTNAKLWKTKVLTEALGEMGADFALHGFSALPGFPLDVSGRLAVSNLIPGTGILRKNTSDKSSDVFEAIGPTGGVVRDATRGDVWPLAIRNLRKAIEMYQTGEYRDTRDRKVMDVTGLDALAKGVGFQPAEVARESRGIQMRNQQVQLARNVEAEIASLWAQGIADKEPDKVREARQRLADWNRDNPQSRIGITTGQLERRVREMRKPRQQRFEKAMPKEMRGTV